MRHSSQPPKADVGRRRLPIAVLSVLIVLAQWSSFAHLVLVPHVLCLEHGEFVEVTESNVRKAAGDREAAAVPSRASSVRSVVVRDGGRPDSTHGHEHCWVAAHARQWLPLPEDELSAWAVLPPESTEGRAFALELRLSAISLLHLAPKTSPPLRSTDSDLLRA